MINTAPASAAVRLGRGLVRPECVLTTPGGEIFVSNFDGGVTALAPDGVVRHVIGDDGGPPVRTNGFAIAPDGSFLLADLGERGGVWRLTPSGDLTPFLTEVDAVALPPTNFISLDREQRAWISVSTRHSPRAHAYRRAVADGFIVLVDDRGARIVADQLGYANEVHVDPSGAWLYVNETFARRLSRFPIAGNGVLGRRRTIAEFRDGDFPDGLWFDDEGGVIVVCIISNRVVRLGPDGGRVDLICDDDRDHIRWVENAYANDEMGRAHLDAQPATRFKNISSIAFGGSDRRTAYLGCLLDDAIAQFSSPVTGARPPHWDWT